MNIGDIRVIDTLSRVTCAYHHRERDVQTIVEKARESLLNGHSLPLSHTPVTNREPAI